MPPIYFDFSFWLQFLYFIAAVFLAFFVPGSLLTRRFKLSVFQHVVISIPVGMVLWGWQGFIFGYLGIRFFSYIFLTVFFLIFLITNKKVKPFAVAQKLRKIKIDKLTIVILLVGVIVQVAHLWYSGAYSPEKGMYFCCGAVADNIYQLELSYQVVRHFPIFEPALYGIVLKNYHYWGNIVVGEMARVFGLNLLHLQFQYFSIFLSFFYGLLALVIAELMNMTKSFKRWLLFFMFFGGDFIYVLQYAVSRKVDFIIGPLENGSSLLWNTPRAFGFVTLFAAIALLLIWIREKKLITLLLMALLVVTTVGFKIYVGIFAIPAFFILGGYFLLRKKLYFLLPCAFIIILFSVLYFPINQGAGGFFFSGFWRFDDFSTNRTLGLSRLELERRIYLTHKSWLRVLQYELIFVFLYFFVMFGTKIIAFYQSKKSLNFFPIELNIFLLSGSATSLILGSFFLQKTGTGNEFNFIVNVYLALSFYAALACSYWFSKMKSNKALLVSLLIVILTLPRVTFEEVHNIEKLTHTDPYILTNSQLEGMNYMRKRTAQSAIVLVYYSPYFSSIGEREIISLNNGVQDSHGVILTRGNMVRIVVKSKKSEEIYKALLANHVDYIYSTPEFTLQKEVQTPFLKTVFLNSSVKILQFIR